MRTLAIRVALIQELVGGELVAGVNQQHLDQQDFIGCNALDRAGSNEISFLANRKYRHAVASSRAGLVLVAEKEKLDGCTTALLRVPDPYLAFALLQRHFFPQLQVSGQRHASAVIDASAVVADDVDIAARCVVGADVTIGSGSRLDIGVVVEDGAVVGSECHLHSNAVVSHGCRLGDRVTLQAGTIIGSDGFGYAWDGSSHLKIPQVGAVVLEDDVEVGANSCIDRGALGDTVICAGTKIDNLVQIGHNVTIGARSIVVSQVGISGSTTIGRGCQLGGQVGLAGHLNIGDGVRLAAKSGVIGDIAAGQTYAGLPAMPHRAWLKLNAKLRRLVSDHTAKQAAQRTTKQRGISHGE